MVCSHVTQEERKRQFTTWWRYIMANLYRKQNAWGYGDDDTIDNAACHAWQHFSTTAVPIVEGELCWRWHAFRAARYGWFRAMQGREFSSAPRSGYIDAGKHAKHASDGAFVARPQPSFDDREVFGQLPAHLQPVAEGLGDGERQREIARRLGMSDSMVSKRVDAIRAALLAILARRHWPACVRRAR